MNATEPRTISAILHSYQIDTTTDAGQRKYDSLVKRIKANDNGRGREMHAIPNQGAAQKHPGNKTETIEIETKHLFSNQANTADGRRIFDWYEAVIYVDGRRSTCVRWGHWLEIPQELAELRRNVVACGYCGHQFGDDRDAPPADGFCSCCLDSPYLKESELHLLRLKPVAGELFPVREPLTDDERAALLPRYVDRQTTGADSRAAKRRDKQRADVLTKFDEKTTAAHVERNGMLWLWERGFDLDNVIYYQHTDRFGIGWRSPVSASVCSKLLDVISEFPHRYTIKTEDGRTLENS